MTAAAAAAAGGVGRGAALARGCQFSSPIAGAAEGRRGAAKLVRAVEGRRQSISAAAGAWLVAAGGAFSGRGTATVEGRVGAFCRAISASMSNPGEGRICCVSSCGCTGLEKNTTVPVGWMGREGGEEVASASVVPMGEFASASALALATTAGCGGAGAGSATTTGACTGAGSADACAGEEDDPSFDSAQVTPSLQV